MGDTNEGDRDGRFSNSSVVPIDRKESRSKAVRAIPFEDNTIPRSRATLRYALFVALSAFSRITGDNYKQTSGGAG